LAKKLGIKEGHEVATLGAPAHFADLLAPLPARARVTSGLRGEDVRNVIVVFARTPRELEERFARARARLDLSGGLWVCWPKQTSELAGELRESSVRAHGLATGLVDNKVCAIDSDWSGLRFVVRVRDR
jgi:hypothetical protein